LTALEKGTERVYNHFTTVAREIYTVQAIDNNAVGGTGNGTDILSQGRLYVSEPDVGNGGCRIHREIRTDEEGLHEGTQESAVSDNGAHRDAERAFGGDRGGSAAEGRQDTERTAEDEPRAGQGSGSVPVGGAHEQPDSAGRGDRNQRTDLLLSAEPEDDKAEVEIASALFSVRPPSAEAQITGISRSVNTPHTEANDKPDTFLRSGGGKRGSILRLIHYAPLGIPDDDKAELKKGCRSALSFFGSGFLFSYYPFSQDEVLL